MFITNLPAQISKPTRTDCPLCGGKGDVSVSPGDKRDYVAHCFKCEAPGHHVLKALGIGTGKRETYDLPPSLKLPKDDLAQNRARIEGVLAGSKPITPGSPPHRYLESRHLLPDEHEGIPPCLLYHPALPYYDDNRCMRGNYPTLISKLEDLSFNLMSLHRTYLTPDGKKAFGKKSKKLMSSTIPGASLRAAIQLDEPGVVLCLAEGVETALWLCQRVVWPIWACYSKDAMRQVEIPRRVREVLLLPDAKEVERKAAEQGADRLALQGFAVRILPPPGNKDWDDIEARGHAHG